MKLSRRAILYIMRRYLFYLVAAAIVVSLLIYIIDIVELLRLGLKANSQLVGLMGLLRNYSHMQDAAPVVIFIASMLTYGEMRRNGELINAVIIGMPNWQILLPSCIVAAFAISFLFILGSPIGTLMTSKYNKINAEYTNKSANITSFAKNGIWVKYSLGDGSSIILHADKIDHDRAAMHNVTLFEFQKDLGFVKRMETSQLFVGKEQAVLEKPFIVDNHNSKSLFKNNLPIAVNINFNQIEESMMQPKSIPILNLWAFIEQAKSAGFFVVKHELYLYKMLLYPVLCSIIAALGGLSSIVNPRKSGLYALHTACSVFIFIGLNFIGNLIGVLPVMGHVAAVFVPFAEVSLYILASYILYIIFLHQCTMQ